MNVWPVIVREVRVQARQRFTYTLRLLGAAAVLGALVFWALTHSLLPGQGGHIFVYIHCTLLWAIWILVPLSTADCVSRERREGTLGLLFLTHLTARDIVFAKGLAHGLRAVTLWLAALPVVVIPFLMGGLPWQSVVLSCAINFASIALALAASVLASSYCREWHRSLALAMMIGAFLVTTYGMVLMIGMFAGFIRYLPRNPAITSIWEIRLPIEEMVVGAWFTVSGADGVWGKAASVLSTPAQRAAIIALIVVTALTLLAACGLMLLAARSVNRRWQEQSRSARMEKLERIFCTPMFWESLLRRWMRWKLDRNPIGWLEQRTWSGRLVMWSWLAVLVAFYSTVFTSRGLFMRSFEGMQLALAWLLMVSIAATAAGSFRRERESGVLELLLVSPLNSWQIIIGRVRGMWAQFTPAVALLIGVWVFVSTFEQNVNGWDGVWFSISFLTLPVVGLYYSLAKTHFLSAFVWTLLMGYLLPILLANLGMVHRMILWQLGIPGGNLARAQTAVGPIWALLQIMLAIGFGHLLHRNLEQRRFALERRPV